MRMVRMFLGLVLGLGCAARAEVSPRPNVVLIYADDLGFGDVGCFNPECKIPTPNIDRLARGGIRFIDAHAPDTICSPSRYGILTGRYSWRTEIKSGNPVPGDQPWINEGRLTLPRMLKNLGYDTAVFGKWGLGADWAAAAKPGREGFDISADAIDYAKPIYSARPYGFTYEEVHLWYGREYFEKKYLSGPGYEDGKRYTDGGRWYFKNGVSRGGDPDFAAFDMTDAQMHYIRRSVEFIDAKGGAAKEHDFAVRDDAPFFLYYAPHMPHKPHVPAKRFQGTTQMGLYGDFVAELDWAVGQIVAALERNGLTENTLIVFTSDNGPERQAYGYIKQYNHHSMGEWRGLKRDLWEGGHRTPFIVSWPGTVRGGGVSDRFVSQTDILATLAQYFGVALPEDAGEDSFSFLDELIPSAAPMARRDLAVHHSMDNQYAIREGSWVFVRSSSGDTNGKAGEPRWLRDQRGIASHSEPYELFNLAEDPAQKVNVYAKYPEKAEELERLLERVMKSGRSRDAL